MLSIIICSRNRQLNNALVDNIHETVGVEYEIVCIDNSANEYSIFSAYNKGIALSRYENLCFVHEDVNFMTINWGQYVIKHLQSANVGIIGIAGGNLKTRVPNDWAALDPSVNMIYGKTDKLNQELVQFPKGYNHTSRNVLLLDGVFLCARKERFAHIAFDDSFDGFHGYDFDICIQSHLAGFDNYVIYDVLLEHFSRGVMNFSYYKAQLHLHQKWAKHLPLFTRNYNESDIQALLPKLEKRAFKIFIKRLVRSNAPLNKIREMIRFYTTSSPINTLFQNEVFIVSVVIYIRMASALRGKINR